MKILSQNCNGKFREKYKEVLKYKADIYVIQECEKPDKYFNKKYENFIKDNEHIVIQKRKLSIYKGELLQDLK